jgi:hypothetical protein
LDRTTSRVDLNGNGDFEDDGELVWSKALSKTTPVSGSFTVPSSATTGSTRREFP